jgi:SET domain-containing protein
MAVGPPGRPLEAIALCHSKFISSRQACLNLVQSDLIEMRRPANRGQGGRGVFARQTISRGTVFERAPVILIRTEDVFGENPLVRAASARISWYVFNWPDTSEDTYVALALGYGSLYNHSEKPNATYDVELPDLLCFEALSNIQAGDEILINYRGLDGEPRPLGFEPEA